MKCLVLIITDLLHSLEWHLSSFLDFTHLSFLLSTWRIMHVDCHIYAYLYVFSLNHPVHKQFKIPGACNQGKFGDKLCTHTSEKSQKLLAQEIQVVHICSPKYSLTRLRSNNITLLNTLDFITVCVSKITIGQQMSIFANTFLHNRNFIFFTGILLGARSRQNTYKVTLSKSFLFKYQIKE